MWSQAENSSAMTKKPECPSCGSLETLQVTMTLAGLPSSFTTCSVCEWRGWERAGEKLPLGSILDLVSTR
jgi:C4-type Zn-finger protein